MAQFLRTVTVGEHVIRRPGMRVLSLCRVSKQTRVYTTRSDERGSGETQVRKIDGTAGVSCLDCSKHSWLGYRDIAFPVCTVSLFISFQEPGLRNGPAAQGRCGGAQCRQHPDVPRHAQQGRRPCKSRACRARQKAADHEFPDSHGRLLSTLFGSRDTRAVLKRCDP